MELKRRIDSQLDKYKGDNRIPAMTSPQVHKYLEQLGSQWKGQGTAMELGCWLGASSVCLLKGLNQAKYDKPYWVFDKWVADSSQVQKAKDQGVRLTVGQDTQPIAAHNINQVYAKTRFIKGGMPTTLSLYNEQPIEICLFDAPKSDPTFSNCVEALKPYWIPGVTIWGLLDYNFYLRHQGAKRENFRAPVRFMEKYSSHFELIQEWDNEVVKFFKYLTPW